MFTDEKSRARRAFIIIVVSMLSFVIFGSCEKDEITGPTPFNPPGVYNGTYVVKQHWNMDDELVSAAKVRFDFKANDSFTMWVDYDSNDGYDFHLCSVNGVYTFFHDSLAMMLDRDNLDQITCSPNAGPGVGFRYYIDQDYLVFEHRDTAMYRKFEFYGK